MGLWCEQIAGEAERVAMRPFRACRVAAPSLPDDGSHSRDELADPASHWATDERRSPCDLLRRTHPLRPAWCLPCSVWCPWRHWHDARTADCDGSCTPSEAAMPRVARASASQAVRCAFAADSARWAAPDDQAPMPASVPDTAPARHPPGWVVASMSLPLPVSRGCTALCGRDMACMERLLTGLPLLPALPDLRL